MCHRQGSRADLRRKEADAGEKLVDLMNASRGERATIVEKGGRADDAIRLDGGLN
jgi:hypothetical protein